MRPKGGCVSGLYLLTFLICLVPAAEAQNAADIVGTVTDPSGAAVPSAKVTIVNLGTNVSRSAQTGASGDYPFTLLPVGRYSTSSAPTPEESAAP
jgi:hypothetical protein